MTHRRGHGEGTISKKSDGRWWARVDLGWRHGKRVRKAVYGKTRREVAEKLQKAQEAKRKGLPVVNETQTVEQFLTDWLEKTVKIKTRVRTYETYEVSLRLHILPYLGKVRLSDLSPQRVQTWLGDLDQAGVSAGVRFNARAVLRSALNQAMKWELISRNAAALVDAPSVSRDEIQPLDQTQVGRLLTVCASHRLGPVFTVAVALGLRLGEVLGLRWSDIDLETRELRVRQTLQRQKGRVAFGEPKSKRSRRTLPLPIVAAEALKAHRTRQLQERLLAGSRWHDSGLVFTSTIGTSADDRNVRRAWKELLASADLPYVRIHDLRHTAATLLLTQGVHPRVVMETLGHSQIGVTLDTYSHVLPALQRDAADEMDKALGRASAR